MSAHEHDHPHHHDHENPHAGQGAVLLDIGGDVGALVVTMPAERTGHEIEIALVGAPEDAHRTHVAVVRRPVFGEEVASLVFPELGAGDYDLFEKGETRALMRVTIRGGHVTTVDWLA